MATLGHRFADPGLLDQALTHPSASSPSRPDNQRFEFLGDRVLGLVIAEALLKTYPRAAEGDLAPRLNELVRRETLAEVATTLDLGAFLRLGRSETLSGGRRKVALLADAMEAVIAALYLDGGIDTARAFILRLWSERIDEVRATPVDAKTRVQEWVQSRGMEPPEYVQIERTGPAHAPVFTVEIRITSGERASGRAKSKKMAEQDAAANLLKEMGLDD